MPIDLSQGIKAKLDEFLKQADILCAQGKFSRAAEEYARCSHLMKEYARYAFSDEIRQSRLAKSLHYQELAQKVRIEKTPPRGFTSKTKASSEPEDFSSQVSQFIERSPVQWQDIAGLDEVKKEIKQAYGITLAHPPKGLTLEGWKRILFFGPPGTGKTLLAAATSNGLEAAFFNVKLGGILSKYFGESPRLISALFSEARRRAPSVLFLDDFEAIVPKRDTQITGPERRVLDTLLTEWEGLSTNANSSYVLTIGTTNVPWDLDPAVISRFERCIYIPLPDQKTREQILRLNLEKKRFDLEVSSNYLARKTQGYSGRELVQLCKGAIRIMIEDVNKDLTEYVDRGKEAIQKYDLKIRKITADDFDLAFRKTKPKTQVGSLARYQKWAEAYL